MSISPKPCPFMQPQQASNNPSGLIRIHKRAWTRPINTGPHIPRRHRFWSSATRLRSAAPLPSVEFPLALQRTAMASKLLSRARAVSARLRHPRPLSPTLAAVATSRLLSDVAPRSLPASATATATGGSPPASTSPAPQSSGSAGKFEHNAKGSSVRSSLKDPELVKFSAIADTWSVRRLPIHFFRKRWFPRCGGFLLFAWIRHCPFAIGRSGIAFCFVFFPSFQQLKQLSWSYLEVEALRFCLNRRKFEVFEMRSCYSLRVTRLRQEVGLISCANVMIRWDSEGPFKPLHRMNPTRLAFIRSTLCRHFGYV